MGWPRLRALLWVLLAALVLLRALLVCQQPLRLAPGDPANRLSAGPPLELTLTGVLLEDARPGADEGSCRALLQLPVGRSELRFAPCPQPLLQQGWRLAVTGRLRRPQPAPHPLLAGPAERLERQQAGSQLEVQRVDVLARPATPVADLRRRLADRLIAGAGPERGGVLAALVLGSAVAPVPLAVAEAFRAAGLSHALAASGFHLSVLLGAVRPLAQRLPRGPRLSLLGLALGLFVLLAGPQPSVLRAVLMAALALLALEGGRRGRPLALLLLSALVLLLVQPRWLVSVGFQLSVVATAALVVSAGPLERWLLGWLPPPGRRWLAPALAVPLAACLWTLPLQLLHFGVVPSYALLANLLAAPLLTPLTLGAMGLALLSLLLPPLTALLLPPLAWLAGLLLALTQVVAALPLAQWPLGRPAPWLALLLALGLLGWSLPGLNRRWRWGAGVALLLAVLAQVLLQRADQLLLVHQGRRDLLLARHRGRSALVALQADPFSCRRAQQLATALGVGRYDWILLLDPLPPLDAACWQRQARLVLAAADGAPPLQPGQRLVAGGLQVEPLTIASRGLRLQLGRWRWLLLPDPQDLWAWRQQHQQRPAATQAGVAVDGVWLGFAPTGADRRWLQRQRTPLWLSGPLRPGWPAHWRASGASGSLVAGRGPIAP